MWKMISHSAIYAQKKKITAAKNFFFSFYSSYFSYYCLYFSFFSFDDTLSRELIWSESVLRVFY